MEENIKSKRYASFSEFVAGKLITPKSVRYLCGDESKSKYKDKAGCVYHMDFFDHDNFEALRMYENPFPSFKEGLQGVKAGQKYRVKVQKDDTGKWSWSWTLADAK